MLRFRGCRTLLRLQDGQLKRAEQGNFGDHGSVGEGVIELRIDFGPGYRLYLGIDGDEIILLWGGN